jgi:hypothetical protein
MTDQDAASGSDQEIEEGGASDSDDVIVQEDARSY